MKSESKGSTRRKKIQPAQTPAPREQSMREYMATLINPATGLPDPPLLNVDLPPCLPKITDEEVVAFMDARDRFLIARADYEARRAGLEAPSSLQAGERQRSTPSQEG